MDSVRVVFTADISDLRRGLDAATAGIAETSAVLKRGSDQLGMDYASLTRAYAAGAAQRLDLVRRGSDDELTARSARSTSWRRSLPSSARRSSAPTSARCTPTTAAPSSRSAPASRPR